MNEFYKLESIESNADLESVIEIYNQNISKLNYMLSQMEEVNNG